MKKSHLYLIIGILAIAIIATLANSLSTSNELQGNFLDWLFGNETTEVPKPEPKPTPETQPNTNSRTPAERESLPNTLY